MTVKDVGYQQGPLTILKNIEYTFSSGLTYVIGRNGAGKSSLLKLLTTGVVPSSGELLYTQLVKHPQQGTYRRLLSIEEVRRVTSYLPQEFTGYPEMTVAQFLTNAAIHKGIPRARVKARVEEMIAGARLTEQSRRKLSKLSGGELQKVGLVQAMIHYPRLCILDEPFEGLDLQETLYFRQQLQKLSYHAVVIVSTHQIEQIDPLGDEQVVVIKEGQIGESGAVQRIGDLQRFFMV
ncbi:ATP-binding cassette domain-containing protein [Tumebacillus algifaecis]|uniref:ATP-binding cassette domain-containing protein n=1 Tax=Tumebacillus algifaecis TaxID=1214604 RepID=UPI0012FE4AFA|nr:ATP-binding cassette domain-containing protein [Tumebacillus algifaecis]